MLTIEVLQLKQRGISDEIGQLFGNASHGSWRLV
jgi:hypothetical protein